MNVSSIGIQTIMPKTGTSPQQSPSAPQQSNARAAEDVAPVKAPPPPGMGKYVDKTV